MDRKTKKKKRLWNKFIEYRNLIKVEKEKSFNRGWKAHESHMQLERKGENARMIARSKDRNSAVASLDLERSKWAKLNTDMIGLMENIKKDRAVIKKLFDPVFKYLYHKFSPDDINDSYSKIVNEVSKIQKRSAH